MVQFYIFNETYTNGLDYYIMILLSLGSILCGIFVIISKNPIVSVLYLIGLYLNIAGYLMMLGINFIGLSYLLVYVGAVSILFLFILMLINVRISELTSDSSNSIPLAIIIGGIFLITFFNLLPSSTTYAPLISLVAGNEIKQFTTAHTESVGLSTEDDTTDAFNTLYEVVVANYNDPLLVTSQIWDGTLAESSHISSIGNIIYTSYPLWLILTSLILLLAMVGAIVITIKK